MNEQSNAAADLPDLQEQINAATDSYEAVRIAAEAALERLKANRPEEKKTADEIAGYVYDDLEISLPISRKSFGPYLSTVVGSANSPIVSAGRGRGGGYYLSMRAKQVVETLAKEEPAIAAYTKVEENLYAVLHRWLIGRGYSGRVTASMRSLGKWSNPDITGIRVAEHFGRFDIEICTIEAKKDLGDWERYFFEAVSHRRYANRAYFAFALPESSLGKLPDEMRYYSELYNVGVLTVIFSDEEHAKYLNGEPLDAPDDYVNDVVEVLTGRFTSVPMVHQRRFCEALDIRDIQTLLAWGDR